ncbi:MAG TPA: hypothetical protein VI541_04485 [Actinomycetota bacterium]|nr:hypothetical protein [Actinomycetota bacterium]
MDPAEESSHPQPLRLAHQAHASGECPYPCPVCMGIDLVTQLHPEVAAHLSAAAREFMMAAMAFVSSLAEKDAAARAEKIPFD